MVAFEHDFTGQDSLDFGWTRQLGAGSEWLQGMGRAAAARRLPMQLCLVTASDLLESLTLPWVTNARASGDYAFCADGWDIGFSAMLHWAVGVRPFKDVMWTTPHQPGSPYQNTTLFPSMYKRCLDPSGHHAQPNVQLDVLVSAFSTGPVGLGDGDGYTDATLALATCRADGILLQAAKPLTPLDRTWWTAQETQGAGGAQGAQRTEGAGGTWNSPSWLLGSYSNLSGAVWQYVVAVDTPCTSAEPIRLASDLYWPPDHPVASGSYAAWTWGARCEHDEPAYRRTSCVQLLPTAPSEGASGTAEGAGGTTVREGRGGGGSDGLVACTTPGSPFPNGTHAWALTTLAPLLPGPGWALLGEPDKFVTVSSGRFSSRVDGSDGRVLRFGVRGMAGESLRILAVSPPPGARVLRVEAMVPDAGSAECQLFAGNGSLVCS